MTHDDLITAIALALHKEAWGDSVPPTDHEMTEMRALAAASVAAIAASGLRIVPEHATEAQLDAAEAARKKPRLHVSHALSDRHMEHSVIYQAMVESGALS